MILNLVNLNKGQVTLRGKVFMGEYKTLDANPDTGRYHTWIEVNASSYRHNLSFFKQHLPGETRLCAVVKANAYGHGVREIVEIGITSGLVDWFAVHSLDEALDVASVDSRIPILILGYVPLERISEVVNTNIRLTVWNAETIKRLSSVSSAASADTPVHVKVETGTNRHGVDELHITEIVRLIDMMPGIHLEGISTHYANIEDTTVYSFAERQTDTFNRIKNLVSELGHSETISHCACSAAAILFPYTYNDLVRIGIAGYGLWPSRETRVSAGSLPYKISLEPVLSWKARLSQVKWIPAGAFVGYGCTFRTTRDTRLGIVPVGYSEGYPRALSNVSHVLVRGKRAPVRGRVCMNIFMIDITDIAHVNLEDTVTLIGADGDERITASDLAALCGTISYEIVSRIHTSIPRVVVDSR